MQDSDRAADLSCKKSGGIDKGKPGSTQPQRRVEPGFYSLIVNRSLSSAAGLVSPARRCLQG